MQSSSWGGRLLGRPEDTLIIPTFASLAQLKSSARPMSEPPSPLHEDGAAAVGPDGGPDLAAIAAEVSPVDLNPAEADGQEEPVGAALEVILYAEEGEVPTGALPDPAASAGTAQQPSAPDVTADGEPPEGVLDRAEPQTPQETSGIVDESPVEEDHDRVVAALLDDVTTTEGAEVDSDEATADATRVEAQDAGGQTPAAEAIAAEDALHATGLEAAIEDGGPAIAGQTEPVDVATSDAVAEIVVAEGVSSGDADSAPFGPQATDALPAAAEDEAVPAAVSAPEANRTEQPAGAEEAQAAQPVAPEAAMLDAIEAQAPESNAATDAGAAASAPGSGASAEVILEPPEAGRIEAGLVVEWPISGESRSPAHVLPSGEVQEFIEEPLLAPLPLWSVVAAALALFVVLGLGGWLALRPGAAEPGAPQIATAVEPKVQNAPTPTGLAASLAVVNPQNVPIPAPAEAGVSNEGAAPALRRVLTQTAAVPLSVPGGLNWPYALEIITPTPDSEEARLLFSDPLVAAEIEEVVAVADTGVALAEQPVILPAMIAEANGGHPMAAPSLDDLIGPRILPAIEVVQFPDLATPTPFAEPVPTEAPIVLVPGREWSSYQAGSDGTHFWVGRPHPASVTNQIAAPSYQFGSTGGGRYRPHHGMDIANTIGTPVRAATTGEVVHAGLDDPDILGPYGNFYGNAVVIKLDRRLSVAGGEMDVYLLYGHLSEVTVAKGQRVQPDDIVGKVGMSGIAIGPHLHVEMRVGANNYEASVNPYLWVAPDSGQGAMAVRLLTADGRTWPRARVTLARFEGGVATWARVMEIYPDDESINPDPSFGENGAMEAVPAGAYLLVTQINGERVAAEAVVEPGKTTFVEMRTQQ